MSSDLVAQLLTKFNPLTRVIIVLCGAVTIHLTIGTYHTFGNMLPYIASYMRNRTDSNISIEQLVWVPNFQGCFPFAMIIGGALCEWFGPRISTFLGCALMTSGVLLTKWTIQASFVAFTLTYGVMFGLGQGIAYVIAVNTAINWAPNNVGVISGIVAAGFGLSSSIFAPIQSLIINPENYKPTRDGYFLDKEMIQRVPAVFFTLAFIYGIMQALGLIVMCNPPNPEVQRNELENQLSSIDTSRCSNVNFLRRKHRGDKFSSYTYEKLPQMFEDTIDVRKERDYIQISPVGKVSQNGSITKPSSSSDYCLSPARMLQSSTFYYLFAALFCCSFYGNMYYNLYKTYGETFIDDDLFMAAAFSCASFVNAFARITWGFLADRTNFQICLKCATFLATFLLFTMPLMQSAGKWVYFVWLNLMFVCLAATHALFITASIKCFGSRSKSINYGCLILSTTLSATVLSLYCQFLLPILGYKWSFVITAFFPLSAFVIISLVGNTPQGHRIC